MVSTDTSNIFFSLFVLSVDGMLRKEALVVFTSLSQLMVENPEELISHLHGWVYCWIAIAVARS